MVHIDEIVAHFRALSNEEKFRVLDTILTDLTKSNEGLDHVWAVEARKRWNLYKAGHIQTVSYEDLMRKYNR